MSLATRTFAATKESASQTTPKTALHVNVTKATQEHGAVSYKRPIPPRSLPPWGFGEVGF